METDSPKSFSDLLARYADGERCFVGADLDEDVKDNDLSEICLDDIDLSRSFIVTSFRGASLRSAVFRKANLKTCDFSGADLTNADFTGAAICAATFKGAVLDGTLFEKAYYHSYEFKAGEKPDF